jgi:hypothetical protein
MKLEQTKKVDTVMTISNISSAPRLFHFIVISASNILKFMRMYKW